MSNLPSMQALIAWVITGQTVIPTIEPNPDTDPELKDLSGQVTEMAEAAHADKPKAPEESTDSEIETECGDDTPEAQDATQAETSGEIGLTKPTWEWDPKNPTMPPWSRVWTGGKQPVANDVRVVALMRDGEIFYDHDANTWLVSWENSITEWATLDPADMPEEGEQ